MGKRPGRKFFFEILAMIKKKKFANRNLKITTTKPNVEIACRVFVSSAVTNRLNELVLV